jgi:hypothetical protein
MQQKGIDQEHESKHLEAIVRGPEARAFQGQFAFGRAKAGFNRPSPLIGEKDLPSLVFREDRLIGQQVTELSLYPDA